MSESLPLPFVADLTDGLDGRVFEVSATANGHGWPWSDRWTIGGGHLQVASTTVLLTP